MPLHLDCFFLGGLSSRPMDHREESVKQPQRDERGAPGSLSLTTCLLLSDLRVGRAATR